MAKKNLWKDDKIQFARLICEIMANCEISKSDFNALCESMDLSSDSVNELIDRAEKVWQESKRKYC